MEPGSIEWLRALLEEQGPIPMSMLEAALAQERAGEWQERLQHSPLFVTLPGGMVDLTRRYLDGAYFRYTPTDRELKEGILLLDGTELSLVCAQGPISPDPEIYWRDLDDEEVHHARLARTGLAWVMPGLGPWFERMGFRHGDDLVAHVRSVAQPLLVFDHVPVLERDEGALARRNQRLVESAIAWLASEPGWVSLERLLKELVARYNFRSSYPPDSFGHRLLERDNRFTLSDDGRAIRLSYFHHDDTARAYLARLSAPVEALPAFLEEYPPVRPGDRDKALAYLERLWRETPRPELDGLTPAEAEELQAKIVPFTRGKPTT